MEVHNSISLTLKMDENIKLTINTQTADVHITTQTTFFCFDNCKNKLSTAACDNDDVTNNKCKKQLSKKVNKKVVW